MYAYVWKLKRAIRGLWFRTIMFSLLGVGTALLAAGFKQYIPLEWTNRLGEDSVGTLLNIMASSMLAVTTFSLNILVGAYASAASGVTPRAFELLRNDATANNALSTFLGAFLFSIVGIIALQTGVYEAQGRTLLFCVTIVVIAVIVFTLIRWINHLSGLGRLGVTIALVEKCAVKEIQAYLANPYQGAQPWDRQAHPLPQDAVYIFAKRSGYVHLVDVPRLAAALDECGLSQVRLYVMALPGQFVSPGSAPLLALRGVSAEQLEALAQTLRAGFTIDVNRTFDNDPRFGIVVMAEIASRALSPATNDSGTAIDIINRSIRLLRHWIPDQASGMNRSANKGEQIQYPRIWMPRIALADVFDDIFPLIARDGAHLREVAIRLQKALVALSTNTSYEIAELARQHAAQALARNRHGMEFAPDFEAVAAVHADRWPQEDARGAPAA